MSFLILLLTSLACAGTQQLGRISLGADPITFTLLGEVSHTWQADVEPQTNYVVIVQGGNSSNPINQLQILIQQAVESEINNIGEPVHYSETAASVNFTAPDQGIILVIVSSKIGENQENLGTFMVQLLQVPS